MLFGYPIEATEENWFHECMVEMLTTIHNGILDGQNIPDWPDIIPNQHRVVLKNRDGLNDRFKKYLACARLINPIELHRLNNILIEQNEIRRLLSAACNCDTIDSLPELMKQPTRDLFDFAFKLLIPLGIRDRQYRKIYDSLPVHVCPFCGCEYFDAPGAPREDLDHYLDKKDYPFAAVNLQNLVPMGAKCNERYKHEENILFKNDHTRRKSYFPYDPNHERIQISLLRSVPFEGTNAIIRLPKWQIDFSPENDEVETWDAVFDIRQRYQRDILDKEFSSMLREFSNYCNNRRIQPVSREEIIQALDDFSNYWKESGMKDRAFIKAAFFEMLFQQCNNGNERLIEVVCSVAIGGMNLG